MQSFSQTWFFERWDFWAFSLCCILMIAALHRGVWRKLKWRGLAIGVWSSLPILLISTWLLTESAANREQNRLKRPLEGFAPTYAEELRRLGHARINEDTPTDDPTYLGLIEAEKRWLKTNPQANDIYTMRLQQDGSIVLVVDSETDYNRDGVYDEDREMRTAISEVYDPGDIDPMMKRALGGIPGFSEAPYTDRWGHWVSVYHPILDDNGKQEAIVGVDFDAALWLSGVRNARMTVLGYVAASILLMAVLAAALGAQLLARESAQQRRTAAITEKSRRKLETLVNSIDGVVWEVDPASGQFVFVSQQGEALMGFPPEEWISSPDRWWNQVHRDDQEWLKKRRRGAVESLGSYLAHYRVEKSNGRLIWIQERGVAVSDAEEGTRLRGVMTDITVQKTSASELEGLNKQLLDASRKAGMAEVATGVIHNIGNVLNSVNVASNLIHERLDRSKLPTLQKVVDLVIQQKNSLGEFFTSDLRAPALPDLLGKLSGALEEEQRALREELTNLVKNVSHIKEIVSMQQEFATTESRTEPLEASDLLEASLRINDAAFTRHRIRVLRDYTSSVPKVQADRNRSMQILINLIRNAKHALDGCPGNDRSLKLRIENGESTVRIVVSDNGEGIPEENLSRMFTYGFTTKAEGHGFGLHSSAVAAREMGGELRVESEGPGRGATFTLELPAANLPKREASPVETIGLPS